MRIKRVITIVDPDYDPMLGKNGDKKDPNYQQFEFSGHPEYFNAVIKAMQIHTAKNHGYAGADNPDPLDNFKAVEREWGIPTEHGYLTRLTDKWCRFKNVWKQKKSVLVDESLLDTLIDLANYVFLFVAYLKEEGIDITSDGYGWKEKVREDNRAGRN